MASETHLFTASIEWAGNRGEGTASYRAYDRDWSMVTPGQVALACSNDPNLGGDPTKPNPEQLLLSALSSCHMLWFLHLASREKIVVSGYRDRPEGLGEASPNGAGRFLEATLKPQITLADLADKDRADALHHKVHQYCFIARSVNFPVRYEAHYVSTPGGD